MAPMLDTSAGIRWSEADRVLLQQPRAHEHDFAIREQPGVMQRSGQLLVRAKSDLRERGGQAARDRVREVLLDELPGNVLVLRVPAGATEESLADDLLATGEYAWAAPNWRHSVAAEPNDPLFSEQYHHGPNALNTVGAWNYERGSADVIVAVLDTGIERSHPDLPPMLEGYNAVDRLLESAGGDVTPITGHGTWVAGVVNASSNNGVGVAGAAWGLTMLPVRVSNQADGSSLTSELVHAATWAADQGADIVSVSYEGSFAQAVGALGDELRARGVLLVWAAGNSGAPLVTEDWPNVTIVGATNRNNRKWNFSNFGPGVDITAPGEFIQTTDTGSGFRTLNGTSFATPLIAGTMGLIWSADPSLTADQVEQVLIDTATDAGVSGRDDSFGWGQANAGRAVESVYLGEEVTLPVPFTESLNGVLDPVVWPVQQGFAISSIAPAEPSGNRAAQLTPGAVLRSVFLDAREAAGTAVRWYAHSTEPAGLRVRYRDASGAWRTLDDVRSGFESARFGWHAARLPEDALHDRLQLEWRAVAGTVFVDSIAVDRVKGIDPPWRETFEQAAGSGSFELAGGAAQVQSGATVRGVSVLRLPAGGSVTSEPILTLVKWGLSFVLDARLGLHARSIDGTGELVIESESVNGWSPIATLAAADYDAVRLTRWEIPLPASMLIPGDARLRLRATGGTWDVDDLFVTRGSPPELAWCAADLTRDGLADLGDVAVFVRGYVGLDPAMDLNGDGAVDAADADVFVQAFLAGCGP